MKYSNTKPTSKKLLSLGPGSAVGIHVSTAAREGERVQTGSLFSEEELSSLNSNVHLLSLLLSNGKKYALCLMPEQTSSGSTP
jgi:hypothetical protein